ncbi:MAG: endopeptidase La [Oscillospiraceae bacterium]|nr:endopeptidase La [Oscillospiraceae bacterium]
MLTKVKLKSDNLISMPLVAMRGVVLFPNTVNHFDVGRKKSIAAIENAMKTRTPVFLITQKDMAVEEPEKGDLYRYGVVAEIGQVLRLSDSYVKVLVECKYRARLVEYNDDGDYYTAGVIRSNARILREDEVDAADALVRAIREQLDKYLEYNPKLAGDVVVRAYSENDPAVLAEFIAFNLPLEYTVKQQVLEQTNALRRLSVLHDALVKENNVLGIEKDINSKVQDSIDQNQREYYLREQIRVISDELGEGEDTLTEAEEYRKKIKALPLEEVYKKKLLKEVERLVATPSNSQEAGVMRTYLDTVVDLPWNKFTQDSYDLKNAERILERDHYGLKKVKERILEYLAVRSLTDKGNSQIICLVGPPGVGKTSIARSIAACMGRKFVRMSLGGVRDEAEIRGHRRTYVGAMPGRIITAIDTAGTSNPLILLDEVDKLGNDYRGDPSSALLEVLDPEQNNSFRDHFLDLPYDLSKVLFITTANDPSSIPAPLYDRMEIIELSSYTREEKFKIAKLHLLKKQLKRHGVSREQFSITDKALYELIDDYTREAGVRALERRLAEVIRKAAKKIVEGETTSVKVTGITLHEMLGPSYSRGTIASHGPAVGIVNGLAWTSIGGEVMPIEVTVVPGVGKLEITGSLGDVMKESAKLAVTYIRTLPDTYPVPADLLTKYDIHIHAPEGAVPKDGPSAGVTLCVALVSAVCDIPVKSDIAMTGEITLKGRVIAIGGLKEKLIAAHKEKLNTVIIPKDNACDLAEIDKEIVDALDIRFADRIEQVLALALEPRSKAKPRTLRPAKNGKERAGAASGV